MTSRVISWPYASKHFLFSLFIFFLSNRPAVAENLSFIEIKPVDVNFAFESDQIFLLDSREVAEEFWTKHSRISDAELPSLVIDWENENLIAAFWKSEDDVVRIPSLAGVELRQDSLRLRTTLSRACMGIITDASPAMFFSVPKSKIKEASQIQLETSSGKLNCF